jgi:hypothetical protein
LHLAILYHPSHIIPVEQPLVEAWVEFERETSDTLGYVLGKGYNGIRG